jgi:hypothetical protein
MKDRDLLRDTILKELETPESWDLHSVLYRGRYVTALLLRDTKLCIFQTKDAILVGTADTMRNIWLEMTYWAGIGVEDAELKNTLARVITNRKTSLLLEELGDRVCQS